MLALYFFLFFIFASRFICDYLVIYEGDTKRDEEGNMVRGERVYFDVDELQDAAKRLDGLFFVFPFSYLKT